MIGLIPAAGKAERFGGYPKFMLPLPNGQTLLSETARKLKAAGAEPIYIGANRQNYPVIEAYKPEGCTVYLGEGQSMPDTLLQARRWCGEQPVVCLMPDTYFEDEQLLPAMARALNYGLDAVIGAFWIEGARRNRFGMLFPDGDGFLKQVVDKPSSCSRSDAWGVMAWNAQFWDVVTADLPHMSTALNRAVGQGMKIGVVKSVSDYHDMASFDDYARFLDAQKAK